MPPPIDLEANIQNNKDLSDRTRQNYREKIRAIVGRAKGVPIGTLILQPATYIPLFKKWYPNPTSHKAHFTAVLAIFRYNPDFKAKHTDAHAQWSEAFRTADKAVTERYESNSPTERQVDGYVRYEELIAARDKLPVGHLHRLLLGCYTYIRPLRAEFCRMAIYHDRVPEAAEPNYILLKGQKKARLVVRHFKTRKHHAALDIPLPEPFVKDIRASLEERPRDWLFVNQKGEPYVQSLFSKWTKNTFMKLFGRPLTISLIRHAFINTLDFNTLSIQEKKSIAASMLHTSDMQDAYRLIFKDKSQECDCKCKPAKVASSNESSGGSDSDSGEST